MVPPSGEKKSLRKIVLLPTYGLDARTDRDALQRGPLE
jgi:hypothetical protein